MLLVKLLNGKKINVDLTYCIFNGFHIPGILVAEIQNINEDNGAKWTGSYAEFRKKFFCILKCKDFTEAMVQHEIVLHYNCSPVECRIYESEGVVYTADFDHGWVTEPYAISEEQAREMVSEADYFIWRVS